MGRREPIARIPSGKAATANAAAEDLMKVLRSRRVRRQDNSALLTEAGLMYYTEICKSGTAADCDEGEHGKGYFGGVQRSLYQPRTSNIEADVFEGGRVETNC